MIRSALEQLDRMRADDRPELDRYRRDYPEPSAGRALVSIEAA
jgi:hypothetical protein